MRKLRYAVIIILGLFFYTLILAGSVRNIYLGGDEGQARLGAMAKPIKFMAEIPSLILTLLGREEFYVQNAQSKDGFDYTSFNQKYDNSPKLLTSSKKESFKQVFELLNINSGKLVKIWEPDNKKLFELGYNDRNPRRPPSGSDLYFMHPLLLPDSSLIFTSQLTSLIAKIDANSELVWYNNDRTYHHSLELDGDGNIYACTLPFESGEYPFLPGKFEIYKSRLIDDHITKIDPSTGKILFSKSVIEILHQNGYKDIILQKGQIISDPIHLNDVQPAPQTTKFWNKDDLLVSCRNINTVFLYRPSTNKIIWLKQGPWNNQHDVDFVKEHKIMIFGNDVIREESEMNPRLTTKNLSFTPEHPFNQVYIYDFELDSVITPFNELLEKENIRTITSGRSDYLPNGDLLIEDTNNGRIIIGDSINKKVEFVRRINDKNISSMFWSRLIN